MKNIFNIILLVPLLIYLLLLLLNRELLGLESTVNFFWIYTGEVPVVMLISFFFISYLIVTWGLFRFSSLFIGMKSKKLEGEVDKLKATLQDGQGDLLTEFKAGFEELFKKSVEENKNIIKALKKENEKILGNLEFEINNLKEKIDKNTKK